MSESYLPDFTLILPEIILSITALVILGLGAIQKKLSPLFLRQFGYLVMGGLLAALIALVLLHKTGESCTSFEGQVLQDDFIYFGKLLALGGTCGIFALSLVTLLREHLFSFEYAALILLATTGMLLMLGANDFLNLFIGLEMQGLSLYVLAALNRNQAITAEAALKYFILGAVATAFYLYGTSLLYGFSGSTNFEVLALSIRSETVATIPLGLFAGLIFVLAAFGFKVSATPFHMWTPDVYEGCPTPIVAFIASTPKVVAVLVLMRLMVKPFLTLYAEWSPLLLALSVLSMLLGTVAALGQTNLKRFLAYSTIGQMGYVLLGIAAGHREGVQGVLVYLFLYLVTILGIFGCLLCLRSKKPEGVQTIEDLSGLSTLHPKIAFLLALFMFSLAGIPPFAGFFAKIYIFKAAIYEGFFYMAILGVLTSVVAVYYYLKIVKTMYFDELQDIPSDSYGQTVAVSSEGTVALILCAVVTLFFCLLPNPLFDILQRAVFALAD